MSMLVTHDGTVTIFDSEIGTVSAGTEDAARREVARRKAAKLDREFLKARDMILSHSVEAFR